MDSPPIRESGDLVVVDFPNDDITKSRSPSQSVDSI